MYRQQDNLTPMRRAAMAFPAQQSRQASDDWRRMTGRRLDEDRRIDALARRLNCLGYFDETPGPRAA
ncbi:MAG: hypothetical protein MK101_01965 [Phycisphaerales bacterium]|nr:hypothetical protein [Phycisphaerales bacterium]